MAIDTSAEKGHLALDAIIYEFRTMVTKYFTVSKYTALYFT